MLLIVKEESEDVGMIDSYVLYMLYILWIYSFRI